MDFSEINLKNDKEYPHLEGSTNNPNTINVIKNLAMGKAGELSAILTLIYESVIADKTNPDIAEIFEEVAFVEMMHLDMLMHAISYFGGDPTMTNSQNMPYSTNAIKYPKKLKDMLTLNIKGEEMAINEYNRAILMVDNDSLKRLFARIIEDEEMHLDAFNTIYNSVEFMSI